jgi:hypothetical protein
MEIATKNKTFKISRDKYGWTLSTPKTIIDKENKLPKIGYDDTYYSCLEHTLSAAMDRASGDCESLEEVVSLIEEFPSKVSQMLLKQWK